MTKKLTTQQVHRRILHMCEALFKRAATDDTFPPNEFYAFTFLRLAQTVHFGKHTYIVAQELKEMREPAKGFNASTLEAYMNTSDWAACYRAVHHMYKHGWQAVKAYIDEMLRREGMPTENFPVHAAIDATGVSPGNVPAFPHSHQVSRSLDEWGDYLRAHSVYIGTMEELVGTVWRNRHTGSKSTIAAFGYSRFGYPELFPSDSLMGVQKVLTAGFWRVPEFYFIEHNMRVDHLPFEQQLAWYTYEISELSATVEYNRAKGMSKGDLAWHERNLKTALDERDAFMRAHGHEPDVTDRNAGLVGQLSLF